MAKRKAKSMGRPQVDRDAEAGLSTALMALIEMARREESCFCTTCRRLRELGDSLDQAHARAGMPFEMRPEPDVRQRRGPVRERATNDPPGGRDGATGQAERSSEGGGE